MIIDYRDLYSATDSFSVKLLVMGSGCGMVGTAVYLMHSTLTMGENSLRKFHLPMVHLETTKNKGNVDQEWPI